MKDVDFGLFGLSKSIAGYEFRNDIDNTGREIEFSAFKTFQNEDIGESFSHREDVKDVVGASLSFGRDIGTSERCLQSDFSTSSYDNIATIVQSLLNFSGNVFFESFNCVF